MAHPDHPDWPEDFPSSLDSPPAMRSVVGFDKDGAELRVDSVVRYEATGDIARVLSCDERGKLTVVVADTIDAIKIPASRVVVLQP